MPAVPHPAGGTVQRQYVQIVVGPKDSGASSPTTRGSTRSASRPPAGTVCLRQGRNEVLERRRRGAFRLSDENRGQHAQARATSRVLNDSSIFDPLGRHAITVAAYTDQADDFELPGRTAITDVLLARPAARLLRPATAPAFAEARHRRARAATSTRPRAGHIDGFLHWPWWYWRRPVPGDERHQHGRADGRRRGRPDAGEEADAQRHPGARRAVSAPRPSGGRRSRPHRPPPTRTASACVDAMTSHANTP